MKIIVLNSTNLNPQNPNNNELIYTFPGGGVNLSNWEVAVASIKMYYCWFNINSTQYNNATFSYTWFDGVTYVVNLPDGYYKAEDLNAYLQYVFTQNGHYMLDSTQNQIFFISIQTNPTYYAIQFTFTPLSATLAAQWTKPSGATWNVPASAQTPFIIIPNNSFTDIVGFKAGQYPSTAQASTYSVNSSYCPEEEVVLSLNVTASFVNNHLAIPSNILYSFAPNVDFGSRISSDAFQYAWTDINDGTYNKFTISFLDQNFNQIKMIDKAMNVTLVLREKQKNN